MTIDQFKIGKAFYLLTGLGYRRWMCTDTGSRVITGICIDDHPDDPSWFNGPPYGVAERVIDEDDMEVCYLKKGK